jgi:cobalt-zinc-cadmium efflux system outer membrane protein
MEAEYRRSQDRVAALAVAIRSETREARERLTAMQQVVQHYTQVLLPLQQTILSETLKSYNGMLTGVYELLLTKQMQVQTTRQYVAANRDFWLAWADLERAAGGSLALAATAVPEPQTDKSEPDDNSNHIDGHEHDSGDK